MIICGTSGSGEDGLREICSLERAYVILLVASRLCRSRRSVSLRLPLCRLNIIEQSRSSHAKQEGKVNVERIDILNCLPRRNWGVTQSTSGMLAVVREM